MANDMLFTCVDQEHLHTQQSGLVNVPGSWQVKHQMTTTLFCCIVSPVVITNVVGG